MQHVKAKVCLLFTNDLWRMSAKIFGTKLLINAEIQICIFDARLFASWAQFKQASPA